MKADLPPVDAANAALVQFGLPPAAQRLYVVTRDQARLALADAAYRGIFHSSNSEYIHANAPKAERVIELFSPEATFFTGDDFSFDDWEEGHRYLGVDLVPAVPSKGAVVTSSWQLGAGVVVVDLQLAAIF